MMNKTHYASAVDYKHNWYIIDATGQTLGRLSTEIARILTGKHKPEYAPFMDVGDFVVVINAANVKMTGKKWTDKFYFHHSNYVGGIKSASAETVRKTRAEDLIFHSVKGMVPRNRLGRQVFSKLKVYSGSEHPHGAQKPSNLLPSRLAR